MNGRRGIICIHDYFSDSDVTVLQFIMSLLHSSIPRSVADHPSPLPSSVATGDISRAV